MLRAKSQELRLRDGDAGLSSHSGQQVLPPPNIVQVIARRELGDPQDRAFHTEVRLWPGASKRTTRRQQHRQSLLFLESWARGATLELLGPVFQVAKARHGWDRDRTSFQKLPGLRVPQTECTDPHFIMDTQQEVPFVESPSLTIRP